MARFRLPQTGADRRRLAAFPPDPSYMSSPVKQPPKGSQKDYPWDSHQDDIVVNTTELDTPGRKLGVEHYRHQLTLRKTYEHIATNLTEDQWKMIPENALPIPWSPASNNDNDSDDDYTKTRAVHLFQRDEDTKPYTSLPNPNYSRLNYSESIYRATTTNSAVFLAMIRIAEQNLPFIDFDSAITHLPNLAPDSPLPSLPSPKDYWDKKGRGLLKAKFTEDTLYEDKKGDESMTVLFLPRFYKDGRHAVGYYGVVPDNETEKKLGMEDVVQVLFTPCVTGDLERWGLVQWVHGADSFDEARRLDEAAREEEEEKEEEAEVEDREGSKEGETKHNGDKDKDVRRHLDNEHLDVEYMECVGARGGKWLECDVVEDYNEWIEGFRVVRRIWEKMIRSVVSRVDESEA